MGLPTLAELRQIRNLLPRYVRRVALLRDDEYVEINVPLLLIDRDLLEDQLGQLDEAQKGQLAEADQQLAGKHPIVAQVLPAAIEHPRRRWWWFLHDGPQVREAAQADAMKSPYLI